MVDTKLPLREMAAANAAYKDYLAAVEALEKYDADAALIERLEQDPRKGGIMSEAFAVCGHVECEDRAEFGFVRDSRPHRIFMRCNVHALDFVKLGSEWGVAPIDEAAAMQDRMIRGMAEATRQAKGGMMLARPRPYRKKIEELTEAADVAYKDYRAAKARVMQALTRAECREAWLLYDAAVEALDKARNA